MKHLLSFLICTLLYTATSAQSAEDSVKGAINRLFTAMKIADASMIRSCFSDGGILQSVAISDSSGITNVRTVSVDSFAIHISSLQKGDADERIKFEVIRIDGPLAIAWTPYSFYYKGKFNHCGVDSYQLVRIGGAWKIQYLIDTRRKDRCE
jgi:hypothetical protein